MLAAEAPDHATQCNLLRARKFSFGRVGCRYREAAQQAGGLVVHSIWPTIYSPRKLMAEEVLEEPCCA